MTLASDNVFLFSLDALVQLLARAGVRVAAAVNWSPLQSASQELRRQIPQPPDS